MNMTLDNNAQAIVEVKTGPTSELSVGQTINYNAATLGVGTLRGPRAKQLDLVKAPSVVYIIRDIEL
ncbi:hypothetical protein [Algibacillus agarilyticus]|uniref:hypothetical protein n=1 Tax=Algibacillus agarilyticus TaxID=2234133 RepID=UPI001300BD25|nr:hypothetical protein [Algibacillus agarilyticus]